MPFLGVLLIWVGVVLTFASFEVKADDNYDNEVVTHTLYGFVKGYSIPSHYEDYDKRRINIFLGIPYARRPDQFMEWKKDFRFKKPEDPSWEGVWDATYYRPACPQHMWYVRETVPKFSHDDMDEDCLYLNIFAPNQIDEIPSNNPNLYPVMVFIHGGGYTMGASQQYTGIFLAERRVVVVTLNYRLNALGFLSTGDAQAPGNYGLWDQRKALEFVRDNIRSFRGNPNLVTIFGQSTGAASVGLHLVSPRSVGLFHQAIMMSGSDRSEWSVVGSLQDAQDYAKALARELGCPLNDMQRLVYCIRMYRSGAEIVNASAVVALKDGAVGSPWGPVVDGTIEGAGYAFLPDHPKMMREQGRFKKIRVMAGLVKDEGSFFIPNLISLEDGISTVEFNNILKEFVNTRGAVDSIITEDALKFEYTYWPQPDNYTMIRQRLTDMMSDFMFGTGLDEVMRLHTIYNRTFMYVFNYKSWNDYLPPWQGIGHGQDLQYVFGFPYMNQTYIDLTGIYPRQDYDYSDRNISEYMISLFTNFSATGFPTPTSYDVSSFRNTSWFEYNNKNHSYIIISNKTINQLNFRQKEYGFWRQYYPQISGRTSILTTPKPEDVKASVYEITTWCLAAVAILLCVLLIASCLVIYRRRPKDY
ncbi:hypothetical protein ScPMuIL_008638 [Solemya velum]